MSLYEKAIYILYTQLIDIDDVLTLSSISKAFLNVYRTLDIRILLNKTNDRDSKFKIFINFYKYLPKQGSLEWLKSRKGSLLKPPTIGGSEIYDLIKNPRSLIEKKLMPKTFEGNIYTRFGTIFEEVVAFIIDLLLETKSYETGSIPGLKNINGDVVQSYSPDRISIVLKTNLTKLLLSEINGADKEFIDEYLNYCEKSDESIILLSEFKCPPMRYVDGKIPDNYIYQPPLGACTIPIIDLSVFIDSAFRKCSISDFQMNNRYDFNFHSKDILMSNKFDQPLFMGIIGIYNIDQNAESVKLTDTLITKISDELVIGSNKIEIYQIPQLVQLFYNKLDDAYKMNGLVMKKVPIKYHCQIIQKVLNKLFDKKNIQDFEILLEAFIIFYCNLLVNNLDNKNYGIDVGCLNSVEFNNILKQVIDNKNNKDGYHLYYCRDIRFDADCLKINVNKFCNFCLDNNYEPIGILPWKLFKISLIPIFNDSEFINKYKDKIYNVIDIIQNLKGMALSRFGDNVNDDDLKLFYNNELNLKFKPKKITIINKQPEKPLHINFNMNDANDFNDL